MGKKRYFLLIGMILTILGGMAWAMLKPDQSEPVYQGKKFSWWLIEYQTTLSPDGNAKHDEAEHAIREIGTNGIPFLLNWLQSKDGNIKQKAIEFARQNPNLHYRPLMAQQKHAMALQAFQMLGPDAKSAVPALLQMLKQRESGTKWLAGHALLWVDYETAVKAGETNGYDHMMYEEITH